MTVYIEYVLINNFLIDYALLACTYSLMKRRVKRWRIALSSLLGACFSLVFPLISVNTVLLTAIKLSVGILLVFLSASFSRAKDLYVACTVFLTLTLLTGGAIIGAHSLFGLDGVSELLIAIMVLPVYAVLKAGSAVIGLLVRKKEQERLLYDFKITVKGVEKRLVGLMDTGNEVLIKGEPVMFLDASAAKDFFTHGVPKMEKVYVDTLTGGGEKICFTAEKFEIYIGEETNIFNNVRVCVTNEIKGGYDAVLHPAFLEVSDGNAKRQAKKAG